LVIWLKPSVFVIGEDGDQKTEDRTEDSKSNGKLEN
jgi:hypothetical protein